MVFPSVPLYLDPPTTWNQQQQLALHQQQQQQQPLGGGGDGGGGGGDHQQLVQQQPQQQNQLPLRGDGGATGAGSASAGIPRPNSMADRARLAKIPQPEQALKCPRCDSTNTKFCYFNNYSLSQPRHFCKTCRRYWTRGGALRNVPVGGGCRRNKRSSNKSSSNKSSSTAEIAGRASSSSTVTSSGTASLPAPPQNFPFGTQSMHSNPLIDYGGPGIPNTVLGFSSMQGMDSVHGSNMGLEQWRLNQIQQFPFLGGMEAQLPPPTAMYYNFDGQNSGAPLTGTDLITQLESVKMEDHNNQRGGMNLGRQYLGGGGVNPRNDQFWGGSSGGGAAGNNGAEGSSGAGVSGGGDGGSWMNNLPGFNSSSTGSLL